jgi:hypothetical protein
MTCVDLDAGKAGALTARVLGVTARLPDPVAVTFYNDPVRLVDDTSLGSSGDQSCPDITPADAAPTVFAARDNPSLYHLLRCRPIFPVTSCVSARPPSCRGRGGKMQLALIASS